MFSKPGGTGLGGSPHKTAAAEAPPSTSDLKTLQVVIAVPSTSTGQGKQGGNGDVDPGESSLLFVFKPGVSEEEQQQIICNFAAKRRVLIDGEGAGDDRRFILLTQKYLQLVDDVHVENVVDIYQQKIFYDCLKEIYKQCARVESSVKRTLQAVDVTHQAGVYWERVNATIQKQMEEYKVLVKDMRKAVAEKKVIRDMVEALESSTPLESTLERIEDLEEDCDILSAREQELEETTRAQKASMTLMYDVLKRLTDEDLDILHDTVKEVSENIIKDSSYLLE